MHIMPPPSKKLKAVPGQQSLFAFLEKGTVLSCVYSCSCFVMSQEKTLPRNLPDWWQVLALGKSNFSHIVLKSVKNQKPYINMATLFSVLQPIDDFIHTEIDETLWLKLDIVYIIRYLSEICHLNQGRP